MREQRQRGARCGSLLGRQLDLSAPKVITFSIAVVIALIASIIHYAHLSVPYVTTGFTILFFGFLILAAGNVFRGL